MSVAYNKFNAFVQDVANKKHDLSADTFKVILSNVAPVATNAVSTDITDITPASGYAAGGPSCTITSSTQTSGTEKWILQQPTVTAAASIGPFRYAVLYNNGGTKPLIAWWDYGQSITLLTGDTFTVGFDLTNGVLQIA